MQAIVVAKPYKFVAPHRGNLWPKLLRPLLPRLLRNDGIASVEFRGAEKLAASLSAGHGVMLAPNHCRPADAYVVVALGLSVGCHVHVMASWHLFIDRKSTRLNSSHLGIFSIYREGLDREALK